METTGRWTRGAVLLALWALAMVLVFRVQIFSGFALGFGDRADGIIEISILEHWRNVLTGHGVWNQPLYFHPHGGTLGYNDGYLLYGLIYSFWRIWFDPFLSDTLNIATFRTIGFFAAYALVARTLRWEWTVAAMVALLFTISNNLVVQGGHVQVASIALLPLVALLVIEAARAELAGHRSKARLLGAGCAALLAAWLLTAYYMAWFTLFFALLLVLCWLWAQGRAAPRTAWDLIRAHIGTLAICGAVFVVLTLPFLSVYLPKARETGGHGYVLSYTVTLFDPVNTGPGNLAWGWISRIVHGLFSPEFVRRFLAGEHQSGFPLLLFALTMLAAHRVLRRPGQTQAMRIFAIALLVGWVLTLRFWIVSPWILVHWLVPGASGLRVVLRYQLFLVLPVLLLVAGVYRAQFAAWLRSAPHLAGLAALLLVVEQINLNPPVKLDRTTNLTALESLPAPPPGCTSFYVVTARQNEPQQFDAKIAALYPHNVDAMYLAQRWRVPTINGFSTFNPPGWNFADSFAADYDARVAAYAQAYRIAGLCRLDARDAYPWRRIDTQKR
ncbi:hypothetical protein P1X14_11580 [Sphingomonas sp. AOB5]|uniref:hypothetical protein n=1 Tax=Sphingomonas sp. AOB5 TaxID=3034017 RepID=UPI0023F75052|nr:hypothetical protein [Sphingomonas sp. AOB5]MDF7775889.1 hypothetical protein [Sphingomonas sp. AOB5]